MDGRFRTTIETPCGVLTVECDTRAVTAIRFGCGAAEAAASGSRKPDIKQSAEETDVRVLDTRIPVAETFDVGEADAAETAARRLLSRAVRELEEYFAGERREFTFPTAAEGTPFQLLVWEALREIPYGETRTYGEIARRIGHPGAARAVGQANNRNPLPIVVPCHRVIGASGTLTGYAGGLAVKERLLELERTPRRRSCSEPQSASSR